MSNTTDCGKLVVAPSQHYGSHPLYKAGAGHTFQGVEVEREAHHQIMAALMAYGVADIQSAWPLGSSESEASHGLVLDRYQRSLWVARLPLIAEFLSFQHPPLGGGTRALALSLARDKETICNQQFIRPSIPCHCERGWILASDYYLPCPECERSGRILQVPDIANH